jgi:hypothetical protein
MLAVQAVAARVAGDVMGDENPITDLIPLHALPDFNDLSRDLVAQHSRSLFDAIPFHHIAAADATGHHFHQ